MKIRLYLYVFLVLVAGLWANPSAQEMPPALVETAPIQEMEFHDQINLIGRSEARAASRIVAEVSGKVKSIDALEGRWLANGGVLVRIDGERIQYSLEAKEAEAAQAQADATLADKELARAKDLFKQNILPERTLDAAEAAATRAQERFRQLEAERKQLDLDLARCVIRAPFSGFTVRKLVEVGEWVSPGTPVYEMVDLGVVKVTVDLPERHFGKVEIGSDVTILVSGDEDRPLTGKITGVAPQASQATHAFPVIVSVPNKDGRLGGGMLVQTTVSLRGKFTSLAVSKDAIVRQGDRTLVYTIVDGKAAPIMVQTTSTSGAMVAVQGDGLSSGMPVVVRGNERIFPGSPVQAAGGSGGDQSQSTPAGKTAAQGSD